QFSAGMGALHLGEGGSHGVLSRSVRPAPNALRMGRGRSKAAIFTTDRIPVKGPRGPAGRRAVARRVDRSTLRAAQGQDDRARNEAAPARARNLRTGRRLVASPDGRWLGSAQVTAGTPPGR